ncbi:MAG TPA: hypothetical protein VK800_12825 [Steroidobacteraceae bacterium]|jgi:hypothetical protein|nr:hypothetical protein [Steroidobacteraceae bacterium]
MGKSSAPAAPDPYTQAAAEYQYGTQTAAYNKALGSGTTVTPTGTTTEQQTGTNWATGAPIYTTTESLSAPQQQILNEQQAGQVTSGATAEQLASESQQQLESGVPQNAAPTPVQMGINTSGIPGIAGANDLAGFTGEAQQAAYNQGEMYLQPQIQQQQQQLDAQLRNQGAQPGSEAYNNAMENFNLQTQQEQEGVENTAVNQGLTEQQAVYGESANTNQQEFGEAATAQQAANQAAAQQFGQEETGLGSEIQLQQLPLEEYNQLESGVNPSLPSLGLTGSGGASTNAPDLASAFAQQYQGELAGYNANVASSNADIGAGASLAAGAISYFF